MNSSGWRFHHVGIATSSISAFSRRFADISDEVECAFSDPLQGVNGHFIRVGDSRIEILEQLGDDQTLEPWLTNGNRAYQVAFIVDDIDHELDNARQDRVRVVREPQPAVAFGGRRVAFLMPVPGLLIELIEAELR